MRIYTIRLDGSAHRLSPVHDREPMKLLEKYPAQPCVDWPGLRLEILVEQDKRIETGDSLCDFSNVEMTSGLPLCSTAVKDTLTTTCGITDQWLDVTFPEKHYSLLNLTHVIDALDHDRASKKYFKTSGEFHMITRYAFREDAVLDQWLFKEQTKPFSLFCTERFAELTTQQQWTGLYLKPVWDSDYEPFMEFPTKTEILSRPEIYGPDGFIPGFHEVWPEQWRKGNVSAIKSPS